MAPGRVGTRQRLNAGGTMAKGSTPGDCAPCTPGGLVGVSSGEGPIAGRPPGLGTGGEEPEDMTDPHVVVYSTPT